MGDIVFMQVAGGTLTATDLPADALPRLDPTQHWSCTGTWKITSAAGGDSSQRNMLKLDLRELPGVVGGHGAWLSASKPDEVIVLSMGNYWYAMQA